MNYANKPSQAVLEWASQDVYDVIASQCGAFDQMNIQKVLTGWLYNWLYILNVCTLHPAVKCIWDLKSHTVYNIYLSVSS